MGREPTYEKAEDGRYVVRLYDGFDRIWMDVSQPCSETEALATWNEKTSGGTAKTCFNDIDYYRIFPADTRMLFSTEAGYDSDIGTWTSNKTPGEA